MSRQELRYLPDRGIVMKLHRREILRLATGAAALPLISQLAKAESYPTRPVHMVTGFPPGGTADVFARLIGRWLSERLGQTFIIENRPGASGNIAAQWVVRAVPDGYTLLTASVANTIDVSLNANSNFNFLKDFAPVAGIGQVPLVMAVNESVPTRSVPEFIAYAKSNPGKLSMASPGIGTAGHVAGELFKMMTGVDMVHVPYHGGAPALIDLLGGRVQVMFDPLPDSIEYFRADKLRALAVTTAARSQELPAVPSMSEFVPGYEASAWWGLCAPKKTPAEIVDKLNTQINAGFADPTLKQHFADLGGAPMPGSPAEFGEFIATDTEKWAKVIKFANIKLG
jgi:tripartite-type tricarboxylate transporter receptor subunit TctC